MLGFNLKRSAPVSRVGRACQVDGNLQIEGPLQIDGRVCGAVNVNGDIAISETGLVEGLEIRGDDITVRGVLKAHVYAKGKLTLGPTARLEGNVIAGSIDVDPGAYYIGHLATHDSRTPFYLDQAVDQAIEQRIDPAASINALPAEALPAASLPRTLLSRVSNL